MSLNIGELAGPAGMAPLLGAMGSAGSGKQPKNPKNPKKETEDDKTKEAYNKGMFAKYFTIRLNKTCCLHSLITSLLVGGARKSLEQSY